MKKSNKEYEKAKKLLSFKYLIYTNSFHLNTQK